MIISYIVPTKNRTNKIKIMQELEKNKTISQLIKWLYRGCHIIYDLFIIKK
jgi:hypothetical protein